MSVFRAKLWTGVGAAVLLSAGGLAACSGGEGEAGAEATASATTTTTTTATPAGEGGEGGEGGSEGGAAAGEAGASEVYGAVPEASRTALRLAHLEGFLLAADPVREAEGVDSASALVGQGLLEVFDPAADELRAAGLDEAVLRQAAQSGSQADVAAALRAIDAAQARAGGDPRAVARGMSGITAGLYREALAAGALDPIEYQHAYAAARSTQALAASNPELSSVKAEVDRLARLFPSAVAPEQAAQAPKLADVQAQASRIELALSGA